MGAPEMVEYDEFGLFHENAAEYDLPYDGPPTVRREEIEVEPGRSLSTLVWGEGDPELVLLHGGAQNAHTWDTVAMALRPRPLIAVDLPGHGHSGGPGLVQIGGAGPRGAATDVAVVVRALAPHADGVVGMSFGGLTALALADQDADLVKALVLVDVFPGMNPENAKHIAEFVTSGPPTFTSFDDLLELTTKFNPTRSESSLRRGILHNAQQLPDGSWVWRHSRWRVDNPDEAKAYEEARARASSAPGGDGTGDDPGKGAGEGRDEGAGEGPADQPRAVLPEGTLYDELIVAAGRVAVPTLLARGMRDDSVLRDDDEARFVETVPGGEVRRFEDAGHSIQGDMPVELAATIAAFVPHAR
jgi:pimeloyl-ACP methyl ester carboxylesterase